MHLHLRHNQRQYSSIDTNEAFYILPDIIQLDYKYELLTVFLFLVNLFDTKIVVYQGCSNNLIHQCFTIKQRQFDCIPLHGDSI